MLAHEEEKGKKEEDTITIQNCTGKKKYASGKKNKGWGRKKKKKYKLFNMLLLWKWVCAML